MTINKLNNKLLDLVTKAKIFLNTYRYSILFCFCFALFYVLPIVLANVYYIDDLRRSINGKGWEYDGRYISTFIMSKLTGGGFITDYYPYSTIFAATITAFSGYILCSCIGLEKGKTIKISSLILLINPFYLQNLSYRWDAIPMSISILSVILPFLFRYSNWRFVLVSILGIVVTMFTYQASLPIYALMALLVLTNECIKGDKNIFKHIFLFGISFIVGLIVYKTLTLINKVELANRDSIIFLKKDFTTYLFVNLNIAFNLLKSVFSRYYVVAIILSITLAIIGYIKFCFSEKSIINKILIIIFSIFIPILVPITIISLEQIWLGGRLLVTFPLFIYFLFILANNLSVKIIPILSGLFILLSFGLMTSYANALKAQNRIEKNISKQIAKTIDVKNKKIVFNGQMVYAPEVYGSIEKYPLFEYIVPSYLNDKDDWAMIYFAKANNYMYFPPILNMDDHEEIRKNKESLPIVDETFYYVLRADSSTIIVDFDASMSKKIKIETP